MTRLVGVAKSATPTLLYGMRIWIGVCAALYIAFWLELDNPYWAGVTVAIVCQPSLGASLRKARFYLLGTAVGAVFVVALTGCFPQDRIGFLSGLALWCAACGFVSTMLRNFAAFAAALAGYTAAIVASGALGATGGASGTIFMLALTRASDISIGIVCAAVVLSWTDFGAANRRLSAQLATISAAVAQALVGAFSRPRSDVTEAQLLQRDLAGRVAALDRAIDEAIGESSSLRLHAPILHGGVSGLFAALSGWRAAAFQLEQLPTDERQRAAIAIQRRLPPELTYAAATSWAGGPLRARQACVATVRALAALEHRAPSLRSLADQTAEALIGVTRALDGLILLADPFRRMRDQPAPRFYAPDWLPCFVNAARIFVTIGAVELLWVATAWPTGALAITFAAIYVLLLTLQGDQATSTATDFLLGVSLTATAAAIIKFAVLPHVQTFAGFSLAIGVVLTPAGAAIAMRRRPATFTFVTIFFVLLLAPENQMIYDTQQFYNLALAMFVGLGSAALSFRLLPPLSPALRTRRLLALASLDLRRLTKKPAAWTANGWKGRMHARLCALPVQADPSERAQLLTTLSTGADIIRLRRTALRLQLHGQVDAALQAMGRGDWTRAVERLAQLDARLAAPLRLTPGARARLRARGRVLAISQALARQPLLLVSGVAR